MALRKLIHRIFLRRQDTDDDIISKKSLQTVKQIINFLKERKKYEIAIYFFIHIYKLISLNKFLFLSWPVILIKKFKKLFSGFQDAREEGLFRRAGRRDLRRRILNSLKKGEKPHLGNNDAALECAAALQLFLCHLKKPVMPQHVQQLLLGNQEFSLFFPL